MRFFKKNEKIFIILFSFLYIFSVILSSYIFYIHSKEINLHKTDLRLLQTASYLSKIIDCQFYHRYSSQNPPDSEKYLQLVNQINRYVKKYNIESLYSLASIDQTVYYIVTQNLKKKAFFEEYKSPPRSLIEAIKTNQTAYFQYENERGYFKSIFIPHKITDKTSYVNVATVQLNDKQNIIEEALIKAIAICAFLLLPLIIGFYHYKKMLNRRYAEEIYQLHHDTLTGLSNRTKLFSIIDSKKEYETPISGIILDINSFGKINSLYGHKVGDELLLKIRDAILPVLEPNMKLYRLSADEFLVIIKSMDMGEENIILFTRMILQNISRAPYNINGIDLFVTMRAGIAMGYTNLNALITCAYLSKDIAKEKDVEYHIQKESSELKRNYQENFEILKEIKEAIDENRIVPFFQPIVDNKTGKIITYESLIRIKRNNGDFLLPHQFLHIAKTAKLYPSLTKRIIDKVCQTFQNIPTKVSINFTISELMNETIVKYLIKSIKKYNMAEKLILEIVESESMPQSKQFIKILSSLKNNGIEIAIDDFGSGYANFNYLLDLKSDYIKLDGSLIEEIEDKIESRIIVNSIISFAHRLDMKIIAEFVSNEKIFKLVKKMGIDYSQGYFISPPKEYVDIPEL